MRRNFSKVVAVMAIMITSAGLSGCQSPKAVDDTSAISIYEQKVLKEDQRTNEVLAKAAALSAKSLAVFVRTEQAVQQQLLSAEQIRQARFQASHIPTGMEQYIELPWDGPTEPLLSIVAGNAGYRVVYMNERPPIGKAVTSSGESRMLSSYIDIIRQQTLGYIDTIEIDEQSQDRVVRVYYAEF